jgi:hypothetical protein
MPKIELVGVTKEGRGFTGRSKWVIETTTDGVPGRPIRGQVSAWGEKVAQRRAARFVRDLDDMRNGRPLQGWRAAVDNFLLRR